MSKQKIVHLCLSCFYIDGYSYQENLLPKYHVKMGYDVTVIASLVSYNSKGERCIIEKESIYYDKENDCKVIRIDYKGRILKFLNKILRRYKNLYFFLEKEQPSIIFMHSISFCDIIYVKKYLNRHSDVKLYADSHTDKINSGNHILTRLILNPLVWRTCAKIIEPYIIKCFGVTPNRCDYLLEMYNFPKDKVELLIMGVDDDLIPKNRKEIRISIRKQLSISDDDFVIITGGKLDARKHIDILLDAISEINSDKIHVIIFGVITPQLVEQFERYKLNKRFHFVGWCSDIEVMKYILSSDLACYPGTHSTLWEETVGLGIPVIFKRWQGMTHVNYCNNCVFINDSSIKELENAILSLQNTEKYKLIKKNAILAAENFKYSNISKIAIGLNVYNK